MQVWFPASFDNMIEIFFSDQQNTIQTTEDVFSVEMIEELNQKHSDLEQGKRIIIVVINLFYIIYRQEPY